MNARSPVCVVGSTPQRTKSEKAIVPGGTKVPGARRTNSRENTTVVASIGADGHNYNPFIIYKGQRMQPAWIQDKNGVPDAKYTDTESSFIQSHVFLGYLRDLREQLDSRGLQGKVALVLDGHASHTTFDAISLAISLDINLFQLPFHTPHITQPLDVGTFGTFKKELTRVLTGYPLTIGGRSPVKRDMAGVIAEAWRVFDRQVLPRVARACTPESPESVSMASGSSGKIRRGFAKFSGDPGDYVGWRTLQTSLVMEDKLHKVLLGVEKAPSDLGPSATPDQTSAYQSALEGYQGKNGQIFARLMLATSETGGYQSAASQTVQAYAPIGSSYNGDGRGAFLALERKYQATGVYCTQELHEKFISLALTADHHFDPANVIQDMRRICTKLAVYNDTVADHRKTFAFLKALPDDHYKEFKTGLLCGQAAGSVLSFEEVADRATSFHAMHIRGKIASKNASGSSS
ncbi:unnamed protein product [Ectocarpus sp. CCAP 1310/34]|nr:unnamed protein product [Ectocarpus sp. CCAP 1310/34]